MAAMRQRRGMATVTVLAVLALVTVLVVGIFTYATRETAGAKGLADSLRTQWLRDLPINLVIAQLREATSEPGAVWASQPGAVRTFGGGGGQTIRKLYSAADMMVAGSAAGLAADLPGSWRSHPDRFVDLNRPALGADGGLHFPILDPGLLRDPGSMPEGFTVALDRVPGGMRGGFDELPMPVAWLYVLRDGTVGHLDGSGRFRGPGTPDPEDNPIIGRIAFWTDDECAKINLNTASEGVAWDFPRDPSETALARFQPVGREFQRQPGHPAMVSLSSAFFPGERLEPGATEDPETAERNALRLQAIHAGAPGIRTAVTSEAGTRSVSPIEAAATDRPNAMTEGAGRLYPSVDDYLFGSGIGSGGTRAPGPLLRPEVGLAPEQLGWLKFFLTVHSRAPELNLSGLPRIALWPVAADADETGAGLAPGTGDPAAVLPAIDRLMRFCASAGGNEYLFQRAPRDRAGEDAERTASGRNRALLDMLRRLATQPIPGWDSTFAEKYGSAGAKQAGDLDQILVQMLDYVREANLVDRGASAYAAVAPRNGVRPGEPRLEPGHGQVPGLTLDPDVAGAPAPDAPKGIGRIATISEAVLLFICTGEVVKEGDQLVIKGGGPVDGQDRLKEHWKEIGGKVEEGERRLLPALLLEGFCPGQGWTHLIPGLTVTISAASGSAFEGAVPGIRVRIKGNQLVRVPFAGRGGGRKTYQGGAQAVTTRIVAAAPQVGDRPPIAGPWLAWGGSMGPRAFGPAAFSWEEFVVPGDGELVFDGTDEPIRIAIHDTPGATDPRDGGAGSMSAPLDAADRSQVFDFVFPPFTAPLPMNSTQGDNQEAYWRNSFRGSDGLGTQSRLDRAIASDSLPLPLLEPGRDVARALIPRHNDYRLIAGRGFVPVDQFVPHPDYASGGLMLVHGLSEPGAVAGAHPSDVAVPHHGYFPVGGTQGDPDVPGVVAADAPAPWDWPAIDELAGVVPGSAFRPSSARPWLTGDFDDGVGAGPVGPFINRPDDIDTRGMGGDGGGAVPWIAGLEQMAASNAGFLAPGRMLPSAAMFGSLPARSRLGIPWVTLLFRPHQSVHPGQASPPDHLLLDMFWMPVVEPWAISEPFSTAGKINMNHQIVPFTYVRRATGLHALLKAETIVARPDDGGGGNADPDRSTNRDPVARPLRRRIDATETLRQFDDRFAGEGSLFRSPTEICELWLVPEGEQLGERQGDRYPAMEAFWNAHRRTGDNTRERPYATLIPRLTTRSNAFTVHYIVQSIRQDRATAPGTFDAGRDSVTGEIRGAAVVERSVDPNDRTIPDFAGGAPSAATLEAWHRYRVVEDRIFAP